MNLMEKRIRKIPKSCSTRISRYVGTALCVTSICKGRFHKHASVLTLFRTGSRVILNNIFLENNKDDNNRHNHEGCARHLQGKIPAILTFQ